MNLITSNQTESFFYSFQGPTVIEPGQHLVYLISIRAVKSFLLQSIHWKLPELIKSETEILEVNQIINESSLFKQEITFNSQDGKEGYGEMKFKISYSVDGIAHEKEEAIWISIFEPKIAGTNELDDELRSRLVSVVNFRALNGHIFLADYVSFFNDFLNIEVPPQIVAILSEDFALPNEGLPLDKETYIEIITGRKTFYGIEKLELLYEEDCNESDDRFDFQEAKEVNLLQNP